MEECPTDNAAKTVREVHRRKAVLVVGTYSNAYREIVNNDLYIKNKGSQPNFEGPKGSSVINLTIYRDDEIFNLKRR